MYVNRKFYIIQLLLLSVIMSHAAKSLRTDEFDNDKNLRNLYNNAYKHFNTSKGAIYADSLFIAAGNKHLPQLQAKAMLIKAKYYDATLDNRRFKAEARKIMKWMRSTKNYEGYYHVWLYTILNDCDDKKYVDAFSDIERLRMQAEKDHNSYGIQAGSRMMGNFYKSRLMYLEALKCYREELAYARKIHSPSLYSCYFNIATCEYHLGLYREAVMSSQVGRCLSNLPLVQSHFIAQEGMFYGVMGNYEKMNECYAQVDSYVRNNAADQALMDLYAILQVEKLWSQGRFDEALVLIGRLDKNDRMTMLPFHYLRQGNGERAYLALNNLTRYRDSLKDVMSTADLSMFSFKMKEQRLLREQQRLAMENTHIRTVQLRIVALSIVIILIVLTVCMAIIIITQRKNNKIIAAENKSKDQFIRDMSHEIRTPLNGINGFMGILTDPNFRLSGKDLKSAGEVIHKCTNQLTLILNNMLDLSDYESGLAHFSFSDVRPYDICEVAMGVSDERKPEGVEMRIDCSGVPIDMSFVTDGEKLTRVLISLLVNACANTQQGEIVLGCSLTENRGKITFFVQDTGCGIPEDKAEEVFKRFVKLNAFKPGIGVGLTISRAITNALHATLKVDTEYKKGARFVLVHPLHLKKMSSVN